MGVLWSRFKNKPGTKELLDDIEKKVRNINEYKLNTERQQKRLVGALIFYSCLFYILCMIITYVWYFPRTLQGQVLCIVPLVLFPVGIVLAKKLLQWYFRRKIERKNEELTDLIKQKRSVLDNVMETETYKVAKEILEKYDPETLRKSVHHAKFDIKLYLSGTEDADETDMETCDEGFESKQAKEEAPPDDCLPAAKILPVDASGDILGPHEMARQPKQAVVAPLPKNPLSKKDD
ncbi:endoplasmic reticulum junction formation protein lunapark-B [Rhipicephalus sanguineus]|uniref:endoplasmic reticulum junction formation protein lunapark-B n=1 Tax=Rhipicephalus sanguineus TaxID=34632 RepID=UPI0020C591FD|nr:endoplasmic reticulum junction formation protein lunapark-B [Rhipicephalus sanguineus]